MKERTFILFILVALFTLPSIQAQPSVYYSDTTGVVGDTVTIEVRGKGMTSLVAAQFPIIFDEEVLEFTGIRNFSLPIMPGRSDSIYFGFLGVDTGTVVFVWDDPNLFGAPVEENQLWFELSFKIKGTPGDSSMIYSDDEVKDIEAGDANGIFSDFVIEPGKVNVKDTETSTNNQLVHTNQIQLFQNTPNPFRNHTSIPFSLRTATDVVFLVYDAQGNRILKKEGSYGAGTHQLTLSNEDLPTAGAYWYELRTERTSQTRKLILQ